MEEEEEEEEGRLGALLDRLGGLLDRLGGVFILSWPAGGFEGASTPIGLGTHELYLCSGILPPLLSCCSLVGLLPFFDWLA